MTFGFFSLGFLLLVPLSSGFACEELDGFACCAFYFYFALRRSSFLMFFRVVQGYFAFVFGFGIDFGVAPMFVTLC